MVGGKAEDLERARPLLEKLAHQIDHMGPNGAGYAMKLAVNLGLAAFIQATAESLALGAREGLSVEQMLDVLSEAPTANGWLAGKKGALKGEPADITLDLKTMRKDIMSMVATGAMNGTGMPLSSGMLAAFSAAVAQGWGDKDIGELPKFFREHMGQNFKIGRIMPRECRLPNLLRTPLIALLVRNTNFGIFTLGNTVSLIGMWMERIAVGWLTWQLTESGFWLGVVAFADFFPVVVIAPFAGAAADRWDRLRVVKISQSLLLVQAIVLWAATASGHINVAMVVALTAIHGIIVAFNQPARLALVPSLVPRGRRRRGGGDQFGELQPGALHRPDLRGLRHRLVRRRRGLPGECLDLRGLSDRARRASVSRRARTKALRRRAASSPRSATASATPRPIRRSARCCCC